MKAQCTPQKLCKDLPRQFTEYMTYVSRLNYEQPADFDYMKGLVLQAAHEANLAINDNIYDWSIAILSKNLS